MRRGQDRHSVADHVVELLFPSGSGHVLDLPVGTPVAEIEDRMGAPRHEGGALVYDLPIDDPNDDGRRIELRVHQTVGRAQIVTVLVLSRNRLDIDAPYRLLRKHLDKAWGKPDKSMGGVLTFRWTVKGEHPSHIEVSRYTKNQTGTHVLDLSTRTQGQVTFTPASGVKVGQSGPPRDGGSGAA